MARLATALLVVVGSVVVPAAPAEAAPPHAHRYVTRVFQTFLNRNPTAAEVDQAAAMSMTSPVGRHRLTTNLTTSGPWYFLSVAATYDAVLGRNPDLGGLGYWVNALADGRSTDTSFTVGLYASDEYAARTDVAGWVDRLYRALLGRPADPAGLAHWSGLHAARGRAWVTRQLYASPEASQRRVTEQYQRVLGRTPDPAGLAWWAGVEARIGPTRLAAQLAATAEAYGPLEAGEHVAAAPAPPLAAQLARNGLTTKVLTVHAAGWASTTAAFTGWERTVVGWKKVLGTWTARNGSKGWQSAASRREGAGTTPVGRYGFDGGFGLAANPGYALGWFTVTPYDYWTSDPSRWDYNTHQRGPADPSEAPWSSAEHLIDHPVAYRYAAVIDFNSPATGPYGSAIFLHVGTGGPTAGCVSLPQPELLATLRWIDGGTRIVMGPDAVIRSL